MAKFNIHVTGNVGGTLVDEWVMIERDDQAAAEVAARVEIIR